MSTATLERSRSHARKSATRWPQGELTDEQVEALVGDDTSWDEGSEVEVEAIEPDEVRAEPGDEQGSPQTQAIQDRYDRLLKATRAAYWEQERSPFRLAYLLADLRAVARERWNWDTHEALAKELGLPLSGQRIGQLLVVSETLPRDQVDTKIPFKVYELALQERRKAIGKHDRLRTEDAAKVIAEVKQFPSSQWFKHRMAEKQKATERDKRNATNQHSVLVKITASHGDSRYGIWLDDQKLPTLAPGKIEGKHSEWFRRVAQIFAELASWASEKLTPAQAANIESQPSGTPQDQSHTASPASSPSGAASTWDRPIKAHGRSRRSKTTSDSGVMREIASGNETEELSSPESGLILSTTMRTFSKWAVPLSGTRYSKN